jgi:hypothetical protein
VKRCRFKIKKKIKITVLKLGTGCKDTLVICNSIFFIFLNQIKAQRDQKIIVWVEYFPYKYSFKVISNDQWHKSAVANDKCVFATCTEFTFLSISK